MKVDTVAVKTLSLNANHISLEQIAFESAGNPKITIENIQQTIQNRDCEKKSVNYKKSFL